MKALFDLWLEIAVSVAISRVVVSSPTFLTHDSDGGESVLRVVHLWRSPGPTGGGGGVSMDLLHKTLQQLGVGSTLLCTANPWGRPDIRLVPKWPRTEKWLRHLTWRLGLNDIHRISSWALTRDEAFREADVVHIHGLHSGFLSYLALPHLTQAKPTVFTLRDYWSLTGHCAFPMDCERWRTGCGSCPYLDTHPAVKRDATRLEWKLKKAVYARSRMVVVVQNTAQLRDVEQSLLASFPKVLIPASVDVETFRPVDRLSTRASLGLDSDRLVVMFTATDVGQLRKGGPYLHEALLRLPDRIRRKVSLLVLGRRSQEYLAASGLSGVALEFTTDKEQIALAYNAADVLAFPSTAETFGLVWAEALACGTPVVSFRVGGAPDHLTPRETGVVVPIGDVDGLAAGINQILSASPEHRETLRRSSRQYAVSKLGPIAAAERYLQLYRSVADLGAS